MSSGGGFDSFLQLLPIFYVNFLVGIWFPIEKQNN